MTLFEKFQTLMTAAAFAEENDHRTAMQIASETPASAPQARPVRAPITGTLAVQHGK